MATPNEPAAYILVPYGDTYLRVRMSDGVTHILVAVDGNPTKLEWRMVKEPELDWEALEAQQEKLRSEHRDRAYYRPGRQS